jgi:hypothetical protein
MNVSEETRVEIYIPFQIITEVPPTSFLLTEDGDNLIREDETMRIGLEE